MSDKPKVTVRVMNMFDPDRLAEMLTADDKALLRVIARNEALINRSLFGRECRIDPEDYAAHPLEGDETVLVVGSEVARSRTIADIFGYDPLDYSINSTPKPSFGGIDPTMYGFGNTKSIEHCNGERLDSLSTQAAQRQALGGRWLPATFVFADNSEADVLVGPRRQATKPDPDAP